MTYVLFDYPACERFTLINELINEGGELRHYYSLDPEETRLALLVLRHGNTLGALAGQVVDCSLGWDNGYPGFVFWQRQMHTKLTAYGWVIGAEHESTLSEILSKAPERRQ